MATLADDMRQEFKTIKTKRLLALKLLDGLAYGSLIESANELVIGHTNLAQHAVMGRLNQIRRFRSLRKLELLEG